jgi:hypothetical protein
MKRRKSRSPNTKKIKVYSKTSLLQPVPIEMDRDSQKCRKGSEGRYLETICTKRLLKIPLSRTNKNSGRSWIAENRPFPIMFLKTGTLSTNYI